MKRFALAAFIIFASSAYAIESVMCRQLPQVIIYHHDGYCDEDGIEHTRVIWTDDTGEIRDEYLVCGDIRSPRERRK